MQTRASTRLEHLANGLKKFKLILRYNAKKETANDEPVSRNTHTKSKAVSEKVAKKVKLALRYCSKKAKCVSDPVIRATSAKSPTGSRKPFRQLKLLYREKSDDWEHKTQIPGFQVMGKKIARGGQATIYIARRCKTAEICALKLSTPYSRNEENAAARKLRTFGQHPNIVRTQSFVRNPNKKYNRTTVAVMEYCNGGDLFNLGTEIADLRQGNPDFQVPEDMLLYIFKSLAQALAHQHSLPDGTTIVHRDIKPDNVMLKQNAAAPFGFEVKLCDFDLAVIYDPAKATVPSALGSPMWHPPTISENKTFTPASDVWAIAAIVYYLATSWTPSMTSYGAMVSYSNGIPAHESDHPICWDPIKLMEKLEPFNYSDGFRSILRVALDMDPTTRPTAQLLVDVISSSESRWTLDNKLPQLFKFKNLGPETFLDSIRGCHCAYTLPVPRCTHELPDEIAAEVRLESEFIENVARELSSQTQSQDHNMDLDKYWGVDIKEEPMSSDDCPGLTLGSDAASSSATSHEHTFKSEERSPIPATNDLNMEGSMDLLEQHFWEEVNRIKDAEEEKVLMERLRASIERMDRDAQH